ncbi:acriflavin resistance protein [Candidatus Vecturithrix granuli]|uniref:Acriflavin resistance protein n=1 Tax=Vecturithrix granuli TaxID=1499967 RepID=A0A081C110_VECG1|nr:acriflavin resistance protein [Candidatus Vecturithrix granuli]
MKSFFKFFAERHLLANLMTIMVFLMGIASLININRSELPKVDIGEVVITTRYPGASAEDVELNVTNKIEEELKTITGIKQITSTSMENSSLIDVMIADDVSDLKDVQTEIREAVARVTDLPSEVTEAPTVTEIKTALMPVIEVGMTSETLAYADLREYARRLEKKLKNIPGVAKVDNYGYLAREIRVEISPDSIMKYRLPLSQVIAAIQARNIRASGGSLESYTSEKNVVTLSQFRDPMDVGDVIVRSTMDGAIIRIKDLAVIYDEFEEERIIPRINGKKAISFVMTKDENADIVRTVDAVKALVDEEKQNLPDTIEFLYTNDVSTSVRDKFEIVKNNGIMGLILVLVVLSAFLNIRSSFWVAVGIPFSMLGVLILLPLFDVDLDSITMTAMVIVIGIIVDDAIVISENIFQRREKGDAPLEAAVNGVHEVYLPVLASVTTTLVAFLPMFFMKGMMGKFVYVIPLTITLALSVSLLESLLILPAHILPGLTAQSGGKKRSFGRTWFRPIRDRFKKLIYFLLKLRYLVLLISIAILVGALIYAVTSMDFVLFASKGAEKFFVIVELPIGTSLQATADKIKEVEAVISSLPEDELEAYTSRVGASSTDIINVESEHVAFLTVDLTPFSQRQRLAEQIVEDVRAQLQQIEDIEHLTFYLEVGGPPTGKPIEIRVVGSDDYLRTQLANDVVAYLKTIEGAKDLDRDDKAGKDEININIHYERLARYGLTVADIAQNVRIAYDGQVVTSVRYGDEDVEFRVIVQEDFRQRFDYLKSLRIPNSQGELIALEEVSSLELGPGTSTFRHYDGDRSITITGEVDQEKTTPIQVTNAVLNHFHLSRDYPGMQLHVGGEAEESQKAMIELVLSFGLAALGIYFLLMLLFDSISQPFMVILSIPFGLAGVIIAFALHGESMTFLAMTGVIGMAGVVVNDALVLVDHLNNLIRRAGSEHIAELIAAGTASRLRPIILTTLTTVAGLLPLVYGIGGEDIFMTPMAMSLGYGLLFATPITLILLPCLYMIGHDLKTLFTRLKNWKK